MVRRQILFTGLHGSIQVIFFSLPSCTIINSSVNVPMNDD